MLLKFWNVLKTIVKSYINLLILLGLEKESIKIIWVSYNINTKCYKSIMTGFGRNINYKNRFSCRSGKHIKKAVLQGIKTK